MPIYGDKKLQNTQHKDSIKYAEMNNRKVSFLVVDVSKSVSKKKMAEYLDNLWDSQIKQILKEKVAVAESNSLSGI